jgi:hypothetical protein
MPGSCGNGNGNEPVSSAGGELDELIINSIKETEKWGGWGMTVMLFLVKKKLPW